MAKNFILRSWFYLRQGVVIYFSFIFAGINTLTLTYYLAIEKYPSLQVIFPTFGQYVSILLTIAIPIFILVGYVHFKRTKAYQAETSVMIESNPFALRNQINGEMNLRLNLKLAEILIKLSSGEKLPKEELEEMKSLKKVFEDLVEERTYDNKKDLKWLQAMDKTYRVGSKK